MTSNPPECCGVCRFSDHIIDDGPEGRFDCRRYPPTVCSALLDRNIETTEADLATLLSSVFPMVESDEWCGEFQPKKVTKAARAST